MPEFEKLTTFREYTIIQQLRVSAGQSDIYAVRKTEGGDDRPYLLKLYRFGSSMNEELLGQILSLGEKHPENLIRMYACGFDDNLERYFEVQEFIRYGSLNRIIAAMNDKNRDSVIRSVVGQVITGLETLHGNNILHLDLKPSNILIRSNKPFNLVLTDFGLSSIIDRDASKKVSSVNKGTDDYRAPEAYNGVYHKKTDYWSLGIIIYELLLGESPFAGKTPTEVTGTVLFKNIEISQKIEKSYIPLLKGLLIKDINSRWGYDEISRWLAGESVEYESETRYKNPYKFNKNEYYTLKELFNAFNSGDKNRQMAKMHISEGYLIKWLESEQDFDTAVEIKTIILENSNNYDAAFVDLLKKYDPGFKPETKDVPEEMSHIDEPHGAADAKPGGPPKASKQSDTGAPSSEGSKTPDINEIDADGETKLIKAAIKGDHTAVKRLLDEGADPKIEDNYGWTAYMWAKDRKHSRVMELLAPPDEKIIKTRGRSSDAKNYNYYTVDDLINASSLSEVTNILNSYYFDVNSKDENGRTPLMKIIEFNYSSDNLPDKIKLLLKYGANINSTDNKGLNAISLAIALGDNAGLIETLYENGADPLMEDESGTTPWIYSFSPGRMETINFFIKKGIDVNASTSKGYNALKTAVLHGNIEAVRLLVKKGADISLKNFEGKTAMMIAREKGFYEIVQILKDVDELIGNFGLSDISDESANENDIFKDLGLYDMPELPASRSSYSWFEEGTGLLDSGKNDEAVSCFDKAIEIDRKNTDAWCNKSVALMNLGRYEDAVICSDKVIELDPGYKNAWINKGAALINLNKFDDASLCFDKVIEIDPKDARVWINKGVIRIRQNNYREADICMDKALKIDPKNTDVLFKKAVCLEHLEYFEEAIKYYKKVIEIDPNCSVAGSCKYLIESLQEKLEKQTKKSAFKPRRDIKNTTNENITVDIGGGVKIEMVLIPAGTFKMGSPESERGRYSNEGPVHTVTISRDFYMGKYSVTQEQWIKLMGNNPSISNKGGNYPVENVSWEDCQRFIEKLNSIVNKKLFSPAGTFRLPTEAEREYACRAGTQTKYYWGEDPAEKEVTKYCWCYHNSNDSIQPVGLKIPNSFGLYDMSGNVYEWCNDRFSETYYSNSPLIDPPGPDTGNKHVLRNVCYRDTASSCRSAARFGNSVDSNQYVGFRLAFTISDIF